MARPNHPFFQKIRSQQEIDEFEKFYSIVSKEPKYAQTEPHIAKSQIQKIYDDSDHDLRRIIARIGDSGNEKSQESGESTGKGVKRKRMSAENGRSEPRPGEFRMKKKSNSKISKIEKYRKLSIIFEVFIYKNKNKNFFNFLNFHTKKNFCSIFQ